MSTGRNKKKLFDRDVIVEALSRELEDRFELVESNEVKDFKNRTEVQSFLIKKHDNGRIRFFHHYEPEADILINDCLLNALGMVYVFCEKGTKGKIIASCRDYLMGCIDKACYLRHLFLKNAENEINSGNDKIQARTVELIVVCAENLKTVLGNTLRKIAEKTDYLHSIGVNLLTISEPGSEGDKVDHQEKIYFIEKELDRAFSWLLCRTRDWYDNIPASDGAPLRKITLNNFRLPGKRILNLHPGKNIHLVHGHNGSGKSTIAEALEMVVTGRSERLGDIPDYEKVIRNKYSNSDDPAIVAIKKEGEDEEEYKVKKTIIPKPQPGELKASSFRMNQDAMVWLTREGEGNRANVFIDAFFPKDREIVDKHNDSRDKAEKYFNKLPDKLKNSIIAKQTDRVDAVIDTLAVLVDEKVEKPLELVEACLPIPRDSLERLTSLFPGLSGPMESLISGKIDEKIFKQIDSALEPVFSEIESILTDLRDSMDLLKQLNKWHQSPGYTVDFKPTLDQWLNMTALTDLLEKYRVIVQSLKGAGARKWDMAEDMAQIFDQKLFAVDDEMIKEKIKTLALERDRMRTLLEPTDLKENKEGVPESVQPVLSNSETGCLNRLGEWLSYPGLGEKIKKAISKNETFRLNESLTIGIQDWAAGLIEKTKELLAVFDELKTVSDRQQNAGIPDTGIEEPGISCTGRFRYLQNTLQTYKDLKEMDKSIHETFLQLLEKDKDGNLIVVLNELINLFTPARWAYEDISIEHESSEKKHQLHLRIGETNAGQGEKARADFRLNTAELNIFALSLFTLCAVRNKNPLSLLIYDDPLQNMDEITVTTIARGFNKLVKLFPRNWQIMMLFHGQEDLERFCREIPAPVYFLPWLSPSSEAEEKKIEPETLTDQVFAGNQDFSNIISTS